MNGNCTSCDREVECGYEYKPTDCCNYRKFTPTLLRTGAESMGGQGIRPSTPRPESIGATGISIEAPQGGLMDAARKVMLEREADNKAIRSIKIQMMICPNATAKCRTYCSDAKPHVHNETCDQTAGHSSDCTTCVPYVEPLKQALDVFLLFTL